MSHTRHTRHTQLASDKPPRIVRDRRRQERALTGKYKPTQSKNKNLYNLEEK